MLNKSVRRISVGLSGLRVKWFGQKKFKFFWVENITTLTLILLDFGLNGPKRITIQTNQITNLKEKF